MYSLVHKGCDAARPERQSAPPIKVCNEAGAGVVQLPRGSQFNANRKGRDTDPRVVDWPSGNTPLLPV
ncbi:hypothetical protein BU16DRAFT_525491, partial [Lophium mytilinum]